MSAPTATKPRPNWLLRSPTPDAATRVFCFPVSGLGASTFRRWPVSLNGAEFCPVQLPGRENRIREAAPTDMAVLAGAIADALLPWLDRPYRVFGHCLGGRIGYAVAVELLGRGAPMPDDLVVSSCLAPHHGGRFGPYQPEMTDDDYIDQLVRGAVTQGFPEPDRELAAMAIRVLRADVELSCGYQPLGPTADQLKVTTVAWTDDHDVSAAEMTDWSRYGLVQHHLLAGDEFAFLAAPHPLLALLTATTATPSLLPLLSLGTATRTS